jgi:hypothetical protein
VTAQDFFALWQIVSLVLIVYLVHQNTGLRSDVRSILAKMNREQPPRDGGI